MSHYKFQLQHLARARVRISLQEFWRVDSSGPSGVLTRTKSAPFSENFQEPESRDRGTIPQKARPKSNAWRHCLFADLDYYFPLDSLEEGEEDNEELRPAMSKWVVNHDER